MKSLPLIAALALAASGSAQSAPPVTTTLTATPGCPTGPPADKLVTRPNAPVPSCEAGANATKPSVVSMSMSMSMGMASGSGAAVSGPSGTTTGAPAEFTGGAAALCVSAVWTLVVLGAGAAVFVV